MMHLCFFEHHLNPLSTWHPKESTHLVIQGRMHLFIGAHHLYPALVLQPLASVSPPGTGHLIAHGWMHFFSDAHHLYPALVLHPCVSTSPPGCPTADTVIARPRTKNSKVEKKDFMLIVLRNLRKEHNFNLYSCVSVPLLPSPIKRKSQNHALKGQYCVNMRCGNSVAITFRVVYLATHRRSIKF